MVTTKKVLEEHSVDFIIGTEDGAAYISWQNVPTSSVADARTFINYIAAKEFLKNIKLYGLVSDFGDYQEKIQFKNYLVIELDIGKIWVTFPKYQN